VLAFQLYIGISAVFTQKWTNCEEISNCCPAK